VHGPCDLECLIGLVVGASPITGKEAQSAFRVVCAVCILIVLTTRRRPVDPSVVRSEQHLQRAWLTVSFGAYSALIGYRWKLNPYFLAMRVIVGYMATKKDSLALETSMLVLGTVTVMLLS
jgi:hypothetical protein